MAYLEVRIPSEPTESVPLRKGVVTIGRAPQNDFIMKDKLSSRLHFKIVKTAFGHKVVDLGSSNGTFINNRRVNKEQAIKDGDVIKIDIPNYKLEVQLGDEEIAKRLAQLAEFESEVKTGFLRYYAEKVCSASTGAVYSR